jgi:hypothetical protein
MNPATTHLLGGLLPGRGRGQGRGEARGYERTPGRPWTHDQHTALGTTIKCTLTCKCYVPWRRNSQISGFSQVCAKLVPSLQTSCSTEYSEQSSASVAAE